jgi:hypothetical protein
LTPPRWAIRSLTAGFNRILDEQREQLATTLAAEAGHAAEPNHAADDLTHSIAAAQICAVINTLKAGFYRRIAGGQPLDEALTRLAADTTLGFDLLERGIGDLYPGPQWYRRVSMRGPRHR